MAHPQITLKTQAEVEALERIALHFESPKDAEAFRHAQRILVRFLDHEKEEGCTLILTDERGRKREPALRKPEPDDELPTGSLRRWTVAMEELDRRNQERIKAWSGAPSKRETNRVTLLVVGRVLAALGAGKVMWAESGDSYQLVVW